MMGDVHEMSMTTVTFEWFRRPFLTRKRHLQVSMMEIYNERIRDLLVPPPTTASSDARRRFDTPLQCRAPKLTPRSSGARCCF